MSNWGVKRPEHRNWPKPTKPIEDAITILAVKSTVLGLAELVTGGVLDDSVPSEPSPARGPSVKRSLEE